MTLSTTVTDVQQEHVTIRKFNDRPVSDEMVTSILEAARRGSPTSSNWQAYSVVVVRNPQIKQQLAVVAGGQKHVETCQVFLAFCADIRRIQTACDMHEVELQQTLESTLVATIDAALMGMSVNTAAESFGLGAVMIGGIRNDIEKAAELLGLPKGVYCVYGMCISWPDESQRPPQKPRMQPELIIHYEQYDAADVTAKIEAYDADLASHYDTLDRNQHTAAWSGTIARHLKSPKRPHLRKAIENRGFSLD